VDDLINRTCGLARRLAKAVAKVPGVEVANEVVLNQVLVRVGNTDETNRVEKFIQDEGTCWLGATTWRGHRLLRVSVSNWSTTAQDIDVTVAAIARAVSAVRAG
jgi:threonine aldolase